MSISWDEFLALGCPVDGEPLDQQGICIDCSYDAVNESYPGDDDHAGPDHDDQDTYSWGDVTWPTLAQLNTVGQEALGAVPATYSGSPA